MPFYTIFNRTRQTWIATRVELAHTAHWRRVGLLKHDQLEIGQGLAIPGRSWIPFMAIHTIGMKFPIDVFFLDKNKRVVGLFTVPPNRMVCVLGAQCVLETAEGTISTSSTRLGDEIILTIN